MIDNEEIVTTQEVAVEEVSESNPVKQPQTVESDPVKQPLADRTVQSEVESDININMRALRESKKRIQQERDEMERRLREYESKLHPQEAPEDFSLNLGENDLAEGKHLTKLQRQTKAMQAEMIKTQQQMQSMLVETRLKSEFPDIDKVVTKDNLDILNELHPEIADTIQNSSNYYNKAKTAYTLLKKLGIHKEDLYAGDREQARINAAKPKPLTSISPQAADTPLSHANAFANGLTEELKIQLRKEMNESARSY